MNAPHLNRQLVLESPVRVADGAGGFDETWAVVGTLWGAVNARSGRERGEGNVVVSAVSYRIVVRAAPYGSAMRPGPDQRFRDGARVFVIQAVAEHGAAGRFLMCHAEEEVAT